MVAGPNNMDPIASTSAYLGRSIIAIAKCASNREQLYVFIVASSLNKPLVDKLTTLCSFSLDGLAIHFDKSRHIFLVWVSFSCSQDLSKVLQSV